MLYRSLCLSTNESCNGMRKRFPNSECCSKCKFVIVVKGKGWFFKVWAFPDVRKLHLLHKRTFYFIREEGINHRICDVVQINTEAGIGVVELCKEKIKR